MEGNEMTLRCSSCGHEEPDDERYCGKCGARLDGGYEPAKQNTHGDSTDDDFYYSYEWFGEEHRIRKWRWDLGIYSLIAMSVFFGLLFVAIGLWPNALIMTATMLLTAWLMYVAGKRKWSIVAIYLVSFFVVLPGMLLAAVPWQEIHEEYLREKYEPKFVDDITYRIEDGTHVICDGTVTNNGLTGSRAAVEFTAYGGYPQEGQNMLDAFKQGYVTTEWIPPNGGIVNIHWECYLGYFNAFGSVTWTVGAI
jgi:zinc-ribbon domain